MRPLLTVYSYHFIISTDGAYSINASILSYVIYRLAQKLVSCLWLGLVKMYQIFHSDRLEEWWEHCYRDSAEADSERIWHSHGKEDTWHLYRSTCVSRHPKLRTIWQCAAVLLKIWQIFHLSGLSSFSSITDDIHSCQCDWWMVTYVYLSLQNFYIRHFKDFKRWWLPLQKVEASFVYMLSDIKDTVSDPSQ